MTLRTGHFEKVSALEEPDKVRFRLHVRSVQCSRECECRALARDSQTKKNGESSEAHASASSKGNCQEVQFVRTV